MSLNIQYILNFLFVYLVWDLLLCMFLCVFRFEKLDITPKSAQKIKPVLEMWMKEAEERYG
jgi:Pou domain - N-terminal to homeobox domain.